LLWEEPVTRDFRSVAYAGFIGFVVVSLWLSPPKPDPFPVDFGSLTGAFSGLLAGLGGFAITVLAVLLGLEALDVHRSSEAKQAAHAAVVRHVSVSLAVASVTCFIGAQMLAEVSAQATSVHDSRESAKAEFLQVFRAAGLDESEIAMQSLRLREAQSGALTYHGPSAATMAKERLMEIPTSAGAAAVAELEKIGPEMDMRFEASARRHLILASVPAFISSFLILQSLTFLLLIRFPRHKEIVFLQDLVVLAFGGMILIKLLHICSAGLEGVAVPISRIAFAVVLILVVMGYGRHLSNVKRRLRGPDTASVQRYTPLLPYSATLIATFLTMLYLAATFGNFGGPSTLDRLVAAGAALVVAGLLLAIQVERPTLELLEP